MKVLVAIICINEPLNGLERYKICIKFKSLHFLAAETIKNLAQILRNEIVKIIATNHFQDETIIITERFFKGKKELELLKLSTFYFTT